MIDFNNIHKHPLTTMIGAISAGAVVILPLIVEQRLDSNALFIAFVCATIGSLSKDPGGPSDA
jgi:hypothetical protein